MLFLNPYCVVQVKSFFPVNRNIRLCKMFSKTLLQELSRLIGQNLSGSFLSPFLNNGSTGQFAKGIHLHICTNKKQEREFSNRRAAFQNFNTDAIRTTSFLGFQCFDDNCNLLKGFNKQGFVKIKGLQRIHCSW